MPKKLSRLDQLINMISTPTDDCIVWPYGRTGRGYGQVSVNGTVRPAHRVALETVSDPPTLKHHAAHGPCRNRLCCNPRHLSWKTISENHADKYRDGTDQNGEACSTCKLSTAQVDQIRTRYRETHRTQQSLADEYGVSQKHISRIVNFKKRKIS